MGWNCFLILSLLPCICGIELHKIDGHFLVHLTTLMNKLCKWRNIDSYLSVIILCAAVAPAGTRFKWCYINCFRFPLPGFSLLYPYFDSCSLPYVFWISRAYHVSSFFDCCSESLHVSYWLSSNNQVVKDYDWQQYSELLCGQNATWVREAIVTMFQQIWLSPVLCLVLIHTTVSVREQGHS